MRSTRSRSRDYQGLAESRVRFPDSGVTIIEGDNEVGKTSIMEAIDLLLGYPPTPRRRGAFLQARGPRRRRRGQREFSSDPYRFVYRKRWHKGKETDRGARAARRAAHRA